MDICGFFHPSDQRPEDGCWGDFLPWKGRRQRWDGASSSAELAGRLHELPFQPNSPPVRVFSH